jgi:hypothetical protein
VVALIAVAIAGFAAYRGCTRSRAEAPFRDRFAHYIAVPDEREPGECYLRGKVVVVNLTDKGLDSLHFRIPDALRARQPDEVGTVVLVHREDRQAGTYTDGAPGYVRACDMTIVDEVRRTVAGTVAVEGSHPPPAKTGHGAQYGSEPDDEALAQLVALPRRPLNWAAPEVAPAASPGSPSSDAVQEAPPETPVAEEAPPPVVSPAPAGPPRRKVIYDVPDREPVLITAHGIDLTEIEVEMEATADIEPLEVVIPPGAMFNHFSGEAQSMMAAEERSVVLRSRGDKQSVVVPAVCITMHRRVPTGPDSLEFFRLPDQSDIGKLVRSPAFGNADSRVRQFATWTVSDDPAPGEYVGIGSALSIPGLAGAYPSDEEMRNVRALLQAAGIDLQRYKTTAEQPEGPTATERLNALPGFAEQPGRIRDWALRTAAYSLTDTELIGQSLSPEEVMRIDALFDQAGVQIYAPTRLDAAGFAALPADFVAMVTYPEFQVQSFRIKLIATWILTKNYSADLLAGAVAHRFGTPLYAAEVSGLMALCANAGIDVSRYNAFRSVMGAPAPQGPAAVQPPKEQAPDPREAALTAIRSSLAVAQGYEKNGRPDLARKEYEKIIARYPDAPEVEEARKRLAALGAAQ